MQRNKIVFRFALGAVAAALAVPFANADTRTNYDMVVPPENVIDTIRGNDVRDTRDSTVLRNDVQIAEPMPGAGYYGSPRNQAEENYSQRTFVENTQRHGTTAHDAIPETAVTDQSGDVVRSGAPEATADVHDGSTAAADGTTREPGASNDAGTYERDGEAVTPSDGGGEVGVPGPRDSSAETDSFEGERDTAAGVESTRGAGGTGGAGAGAGAGGAGAGAGGTGAGH